MTGKKMGRPQNFITVESEQKKISLVGSGREFSVGELLADFLYVNFHDYENQRKKILAATERKNFSKKDKQEYVSDCLWREIQNLAGEHPYFEVIDHRVLDEIDYRELLTATFDLLKIQKLFDRAFRHCLYREYMDDLKPLTAIKRYYIYNALYNSPFERLGINARVHYEPIKSRGGVVFGGGQKNLDDLLPMVSDGDFFLTEHYYGYDIASLLYVEFSKMVALNILATKCANCERYFVLKGQYRTKYCTRPVGNEGVTCKTIGASKKYKEKISDSPIGKLYTTVYKRIHTRRAMSRISDEIFIQQKQKIAELRQNAEEGSISFEDYKSQMGNI